MYERINITEKRSMGKSRKSLGKIQRKKNYTKTKNSPVDRILFLQRTAGNQAVQRLIKSGALQAKLRIGQPGDIYEQEADRVAEQVMRMPEPQAISSGTPYIHSIQRACIRSEDEVLSRQPIEEEKEKEDELRRQPIEEEEEELQAKATSDGISEVNPDIESHIQNMRGGGQPLPESARAYFEPRFGQDFSQVRVHSDAEAAEAAQEVNARAYTVGQDVIFGAGQYSETSAGQKLLAHELTHVVQQEKGIQRNVIQRRSGCSAAQDTKITDDHVRARGMLSAAISAVSSYNGTTPPNVFNALSRHFHGATSNAFATWINVNLRFLWGVTWMAGYECYTGGLLERVWACGPNDLATTFWCVPQVNIRLCPSYFGQGQRERSTTMIHEWVHKYGCNFDLGYEGDPDYPQNWTVTQLLNADSFSSFIRDVS